MNWWKVICAFSIAIYGSSCLAQDITDVEAKPYGSYSGGAIDTVDLSSGNLMLNIPLISYPQRGSLPPLSFSVELNNAPYSQTLFSCDYLGYPSSLNSSIYINPKDGNDMVCGQLTSRYDTAPPGAAYITPSTSPNWVTYTTISNNDSTCGHAPDPTAPGGVDTTPCTIDYVWATENAAKIHNIGVYLTSSFSGGMVTGQYLSNTIDDHGNGYGTYEYSLIDPSGTTRKLESDNSNPPTSWNTYRAPDGSGYTFIPAGSGHAYDSSGNSGDPVWISDVDNSAHGARLGTVYSPTGIQYRDSIATSAIPVDDTGCTQSPGDISCTPHFLQSTATDPSGKNTITRNAWYWTGYRSKENANYNPPFGAINSIYAGLPAPKSGLTPGPYYVDSVGRVIPDVIAMQATEYLWQLDGGVGNYKMTWKTPGAGDATLPYTIRYENLATTITTTSLTFVCPTGSGCEPTTGHAAPDTPIYPDPANSMDVNGYTIKSIELPNGTSWTFEYSPVTTDLTKITAPSGGSISYKYVAIDELPPIWISRCNGICHAVQSRIENDGRNNISTTYYTYGVYTAANLPSACANVSSYAYWTTETDPLGNDTVHSFCAIGVKVGTPVASQYKEIQTDYYQGCLVHTPSGDGSSPDNPNSLFNPSSLDTPGCTSTSGRTLMKTVVTLSTPQTDMSTMFGSGTPGTINTVPYQITTSTVNGKTSTETRQYSTLFKATKVICTNGSSTTCTPSYSSGNPWIPINYLLPTSSSIVANSGMPLRSTKNTYMFQSSDPSYANSHMDALPLSAQVYAGTTGGGDYSSDKTIYTYDENNPSTCSSPTTQNGIFGNQSSKTEWYEMPSSGGEVQTQTFYNCNSMPIAKSDGKGFKTTINYDSSGLFPSSVQRPTTNGVTHIDHYEHELNTSELVSHTDENSQKTSYSYDIMGRVTSIQYPDGGGSTFCYTDIGGTIPGCGSSPGAAPYKLYTSTTTGTKSVSGSPMLTVHSYDGWGRQYQSEIASDPGGATYVDTTYDANGRVVSVTNPYRDTPGPSTVYTYDALGRKTAQTQPDDTTQNHSIQKWEYNGDGIRDWLYITDETGRKTIQILDALGHLVEVLEPDTNSGDPTMETDYTYDVVGDLLNVNQQGVNGAPVIRTFQYDMPSRVTFACNPETLATGQDCSMGVGTTYNYDANSNLRYKKDNRGVVTTYKYDALNRLLSKTYSYDPSGTASSCYLYDSASNGLGRLGAQWTQKDPCSPDTPALPTSGILTRTSISAYDQMGRLLSEGRCMGITDCANNAGYAMNYTYDLTGKLLTYPSGYGNLSFTNSYDSIGHLLGVMQGLSKNLFSVPKYTPAGALFGVQLGPINMGRIYDSRQRVINETDQF